MVTHALLNTIKLRYISFDLSRKRSQCHTVYDSCIYMGVVTQCMIHVVSHRVYIHMYMYLLQYSEGLPHGAGTAMAVDQILSSVAQHKQNVKHLLLAEQRERERERERGGLK